MLVNHGAGGNSNFIATWLEHVLSNNTTQDTITQRGDNIATLNNRCHQQAFCSATVYFCYHYVLRYIHQTTGQITGVSCFQCSIRQTLTSTVGGDKVLKYTQPLTEVGGNGRFNNRAIWSSHQATHTSQLSNLSRGTTSTRVGHDKDGVKGILLLFLTLFIDNTLCADALHHRLGNPIISLGPDIDYLVVFFALGHKTRGELAFDLTNLFVSAGNNVVLVIWDNKIVNTNGCARAG